MTWTEGTIQLTETIIINGGYWGIITFCLLQLVILGVLLMYGYAMWMICDEICNEW